MTNDQAWICSLVTLPSVECKIIFELIHSLSLFRHRCRTVSTILYTHYIVLEEWQWQFIGKTGRTAHVAAAATDNPFHWTTLIRYSPWGTFWCDRFTEYAWCELKVLESQLHRVSISINIIIIIMPNNNTSESTNINMQNFFMWSSITCTRIAATLRTLRRHGLFQVCNFEYRA